MVAYPSVKVTSSSVVVVSSDSAVGVCWSEDDARERLKSEGESRTSALASSSASIFFPALVS